MTDPTIIPLDENGNIEVRVRIRRRPTEFIAVAEPDLATAIEVKSNRPLRRDAQESHDALCGLIAKMIETEPQASAGHLWAGPFTHAAWARAMGVSPRTFQRLITHPPIVAQACGRGSDKGTLLRLGTPDARNLKKVQNTMSKIWRANRGRDTTTRDEYGCICGMAEEMPPGWQVRIFEHALLRWSAFMAIVKLEIETAQQSAGHDIFEPSAMANPMLETARRFHGEELFSPGHLRWPSLKFLRKFHHVATDLFISDKGYPRERVFGLSE